MEKFVNLNIHSDYSILDSTIKIDRIVSAGVKYGVKYLTLTDFNSLGGIPYFIGRCLENGIKPITGAEVEVRFNRRLFKIGNKVGNMKFNSNCLSSVAENMNHAADSSAYRFKMLFLIKNIKGYFSLVKIISERMLNRSISLNRVIGILQGLIVIEGKTDSLIYRLYHNNDKKNIKRYIDFLVGKIGKHNIYFAAQDSKTSSPGYKKFLKRAAGYTGTGIAVVNDVHFIFKCELETYRILKSASKLVPVDTLTEDYSDCYMKPYSLLEKKISHSEYFRNTFEIAEKCNFDFKFTKQYLPKYLRSKKEEDRLLWNLCSKKISEIKPPVYSVNRFETEFKVITGMKLSGYFLFVWDIVRYSKKNGILFLCKGSAASSYIAYLLGITFIDPLKFGLYFERFLNEERCNYPDFDLDFHHLKREKVLKYIKEKYGNSNVASICTYSTFRLRTAVKDAGRSLNIPFDTLNRITAGIPFMYADGKHINRIFSSEPCLKNIPVNEEPVKSLLKFAGKITGLIRHTGTHTSGVIISDMALGEHIPVMRNNNNIIVTQYDKEVIEQCRVMKIDIIGSRNLGVIDETLKNLNKKLNKKISLENIPLNDVKTFNMIRQGKTIGCFQLESPGMRSMVKKLGPCNVKDLSIVVALYRPGPLQAKLTEKYIARFHGKEPVRYYTEKLEKILKYTLGVVLYQEQVMLILHKLASLNLAESDVIRRSMAGRNMKKINNIRKRFIQGCLENGIGKKTSILLFDMLLKFSGYCFNKAHSVAYAYAAYYSSYLKCNYPAEYLAAVLNARTGYYPMTEYIEELRRFNIKVGLPDINESRFKCIVDTAGLVRIGFIYIKGITPGMIKFILSERKKRRFFSVEDFLRRFNKY